MSEKRPEHAVESEAYATSREDRDRTMVAIRELEAALARAAGAENWQVEVIQGLVDLEAAMDTEQAELERPDSLLALVAAEHSRRFGPRIRNFREQYGNVARQATSLRTQLETEEPDSIGADDVRHRVGWIINALTHCRARQTDLVYEALTLDLGAR
jgi:hypothetical protein